jgi:hypothetical protein
MIAVMLRLPFLLAPLLSLTLLLAPSSGGAPSAAAAGGCGIPGGGEHLGPTYLTVLSVRGTSCATGLAVVRAYHSCQLRDGGVKARCRSLVHGFRCSERRGPAIPTEFYSSVSCQSQGRRVSYTYSQFT